jgi:hypothetical protein
MHSKSKKQGGHKHLQVLTSFSCATLFALLTLSLPSAAFLQDSTGGASSAYECTQVALDGVDEALLTRQERIALLDESLSASIDNYSTCVGTVAQTMSGGGAGGGSGDSGDSGDGGDAGNSGSSGTSASGSEQGASSSNSNADESAIQGQGLSGTGIEQTTPPQPGANSSQGMGSTSAARGIIPPKNNDKIICKLLYQEITKTKDPDMLEGLRQQYSNYKCGT